MCGAIVVVHVARQVVHLVSQKLLVGVHVRVLVLLVGHVSDAVNVAALTQNVVI